MKKGLIASVVFIFISIIYDKIIFTATTINPKYILCEEMPDIINHMLNSVLMVGFVLLIILLAVNLFILKVNRQQIMVSIITFMIFYSIYFYNVINTYSHKCVEYKFLMER